MTRRLLNLLSILSLLLFAAAAALWVRSCFVRDTILWCPLWESADGSEFESGEYLLDSRRGALHVGVIRHRYHKVGMVFEYDLYPVMDPQLQLSDRWTTRAPDDRSEWGFSGWTLKESRRGRRTLGVGWSTPYWFLLLLFSLPPTLHAVLSRRRRRRRQLGLCPRCGYDLRATPDKCPECGHVPGGAHCASVAAGSGV